VCKPHVVCVPTDRVQGPEDGAHAAAMEPEDPGRGGERGPGLYHAQVPDRPDETLPPAHLTPR